MLKCRDVSEMASDYLDSGLTLRARLGMRLHLALCGMCRAYLDQLRKTTRLLGQGTLPPAAPETEARLVMAATAPPPSDGPA
jgi:hypothetical protein